MDSTKRGFSIMKMTPVHRKRPLTISTATSLVRLRSEAMQSEHYTVSLTQHYPRGSTDPGKVP